MNGPGKDPAHTIFDSGKLRSDNKTAASVEPPGLRESGAPGGFNYPESAHLPVRSFKYPHTALAGHSDNQRMASRLSCSWLLLLHVVRQTDHSVSQSALDTTFLLPNIK
jgi:hypothetical protein